MIDFYIYDTIIERELEVTMKDNELREKVARLEEKIDNLGKLVEQIPLENAEIKEFKRMLRELTTELGFSFDEDGIFNRDAKLNSALGKLQLQISALIEAGGYKETYSEGKLIFEKSR